jgi:hypothetical protein
MKFALRRHALVDPTVIKRVNTIRERVVRPRAHSLADHDIHFGIKVVDIRNEESLDRLGKDR